MSSVKLLTTLILISIFYSVGVNLIVSAMPAAYISGTTDYTDNSNYSKDLNFLLPVQENVDSVKNLSFITDIGLLVIHTGFIWLDLILNFFTALPALFTLLITNFFLIFPGVNPDVVMAIRTSTLAITSFIYLLMLISFISELFTGRSIGGVA